MGLEEEAEEQVGLPVGQGRIWGWLEAWSRSCAG